MSIKSLIFFATLLATQAAFAQDMLSDEISWTVTQLNDLRANSKSAYKCIFRTRGTNSIVWEQKAITMVFTVESSQGSWSDLKKTGNVVYNVDTDGTKGTLKFEKSSSGYLITIDLLQAPGDHFNHQFLVTKISKSN